MAAWQLMSGWVNFSLKAYELFAPIDSLEHVNLVEWIFFQALFKFQTLSAILYSGTQYQSSWRVGQCSLPPELILALLSIVVLCGRKCGGCTAWHLRVSAIDRCPEQSSYRPSTGLCSNVMTTHLSYALVSKRWEPWTRLEVTRTTRSSQASTTHWM